MAASGSIGVSNRRRRERGRPWYRESKHVFMNCIGEFALNRFSFLFVAIFVSTAVVDSADALAEDHEVIRLWPEGLPAGSVELDADRVEKLKSERTEERIKYVGDPTLTVFPAPKENANGCAVIICPGGGYNILAWPKEGTEVAEWFNTLGVTAFVMQYRVPRRTPDKIHWEPMQDVQRAIRVVRHQAETRNIDPKRVGTLGFSAGGHLTVMSGVQYGTKCYEPFDEADALSCRPDFICPIYAAYLGDGYDDKKAAKLGELVTVDKNTPPTFLAVTWDDALRGAQSALLFARLREHGVPAELHAYSKGGHGYGIRPSANPVSTWHHQLAGWLKTSGFLSPEESVNPN